MAAIYEKLKMMREKAGLRQGQIADYLGVTQTFISKVETEEEIHPIQFAFRAQEVSREDLRIIADIGKIAINSRFMAKVLEESNVG